MSNFHAIATVTATLSQILNNVEKDVENSIVTYKPPDVKDKAVGDPANILNIFLYQVTPNTAYRNLDLPARQSNGDLINKPLLALNLHYLLTAYNKDNDELKAQQVMASAMRLLLENQVLTRERIRQTIQNDNLRATLGESDLADQIELVKLNLQPMSTEEISKLWSSFFQVNYRLSTAYQATVVILEGSQEPKSSLPVLERQLLVTPFKQLFIDRVEPQIVSSRAGAKIDIIGRNLKAEKVLVRFGELECTPTQEDTVRDAQITMTIPSNLAAGVTTVQVIHPLLLGEQKVEHHGFESNVAAFVLSPKITKAAIRNDASGRTLTIDFVPAITPQQKVTIIIGDYSVPIAETRTEPVNSLSLKIPSEMQPKIYFVRMRVDGAESLLETENGVYAGPKVKVEQT
jgi:hypothetical protein